MWSASHHDINEFAGLITRPRKSRNQMSDILDRPENVPLPSEAGGENSLRGLLCAVIVDNGGMGLVACPDLSEIRGLVLSVFRAVTISVAQGCTKKSADGINFRRSRP